MNFKKIDKFMGGGSVKILGFSTEAWLIAFFIAASLPIFNIVAIPAFIVAFLLGLMLFIGWRVFSAPR